MKRSTINQIIQEAEQFSREHSFFLPPFASWTPAQWQESQLDLSQVVSRQLGWDVTDFGQGNFQEQGLTLFTIRNGNRDDLARGQGLVYAEKLLVVGVDQITPLHYHWHKTEDIINRAGGRLVLRLFNATEDDQLADSEVTVSVNSIPRRLEAGGVLVLEPGESVTLTPGLFHAFWGEGQRVLVGEISSVNDDSSDNNFYDPLGRFPTIEEDEPPYRLLVGDYESWLSPSTGRPS